MNHLTKGAFTLIIGISCVASFAGTVGIDSKATKLAMAEGSSAAINTSKTVTKVFDKKQRVFSVGYRDQRVRVYLAGKFGIDNYLQNSLQRINLMRDPKGNGRLTTLFGTQASSPRDRVLGPFAKDPTSKSNNNNHSGLIVNPDLVVCASDLLKRVKAAGDKHPEIIQEEVIDEINIFLKPIGHISYVKAEDTHLQISPVAGNAVDPALNVRIPFVITPATNTYCMLPSVSQIETALCTASGSECNIESK
jgi:hypothetical protein